MHIHYTYNMMVTVSGKNGNYTRSKVICAYVCIERLMFIIK